MAVAPWGSLCHLQAHPDSLTISAVPVTCSPPWLAGVWYWVAHSLEVWGNLCRVEQTFDLGDCSQWEISSGPEFNSCSFLARSVRSCNQLHIAAVSLTMHPHVISPHFCDSRVFPKTALSKQIILARKPSAASSALGKLGKEKAISSLWNFRTLGKIAYGFPER